MRALPRMGGVTLEKIIQNYVERERCGMGYDNNQDGKGNIFDRLLGILKYVKKVQKCISFCYIRVCSLSHSDCRY